MLPRLNTQSRVSNLRKWCNGSQPRASRSAFHSSSALLRVPGRNNIKYDDTPKKTKIEFKEAPNRQKEEEKSKKSGTSSFMEMLNWYKKYRVPMIGLMLVSLVALKSLDLHSKFNCLSEEDQAFVSKGFVHFVYGVIGKDVAQKYVYTEAELQRAEKESWWTLLSETDPTVNPAERIIKCLNVYRDDFTKEDKKHSKKGGVIKYSSFPLTEQQYFTHTTSKETEALLHLGQEQHQDQISKGVPGASAKASDDNTETADSQRGYTQIFSPFDANSSTSRKYVHKTSCATVGRCVCDLWMHKDNTPENALFGGNCSMQDRDAYESEASLFLQLPKQQLGLLRQLPKVIYPYFVSFLGSPEYTKYLQGYTGLGHGSTLQYTSFPPSSCDEDHVTESSGLVKMFQNKRQQHSQNELFRAVRDRLEDMDSVMNSKNITLPSVDEPSPSFDIGLDKNLNFVSQLHPSDAEGKYNVYARDPYTDMIVYPTRVPYTQPADVSTSRDFSKESLSTQVNVPEHHPKLMNLLLLRAVQGLAFLQKYGEEQRAAGTSSTSLHSEFEDVMSPSRKLDTFVNTCKQNVHNAQEQSKHWWLRVKQTFLETTTSEDEILSSKMACLFAPEHDLLRGQWDANTARAPLPVGETVSRMQGPLALSEIMAKCPQGRSKQLSMLFGSAGEGEGLRQYMGGDGLVVDTDGNEYANQQDVPDAHVHLLPHNLKILRDPRALHWDPNPWSVREVVRTLALWKFLPLIPVRLVTMTAAFTLLWFFSRLSIIGLDTSKENYFGSKVPRSWIRKAVMSPCKLLARIALFCMGFHWVSVQGKLAPPKHAPIIVSNHISVTDAVLLYIFAGPSASFIAKEGVLGVPLLGDIILANGSILVDRADPASRRVTQNEITRRATHTHNNEVDPFDYTVIFPEGTTTVGESLLQFKEGAFRPGVPVQPVVQQYPHKSFNPTYAGPDKTGVFCFLRTVFQFYNSVSVNFLPVYIPTELEKLDAKLYARNVQIAMARSAAIPYLNQTAY